MNEPLTDTIVCLFVVALLAAVFSWLPRLTRPDLYFAVTVPPGFRDSAEGRERLQRYRRELLLYSPAAVVLVILGAQQASGAVLTAGILVEYAACLAAYLRARSRVLPHAVVPTAVREAALSPRQVSLPGGWLLQSAPFLLLAATALYLNSRWADIPARFPIDWGNDGKPNAWATRSLSGVYGPLISGAVLCLMLGGLAYGLLRWSRPINLSGGLGQAEASFRRTVVGILVAAQCFLTAVFVWTALLPLSASSARPPGVWAVLALAIVFSVVTTVILVRKGQGGTRVRGSASAGGLEEEKQTVGDRTLDHYWKAGIFYVNPDDPALFIEKRFGIGYTLNFGRPAVWVVLVAALLLPVAATLVFKWAAK
jgi:uncharacterized membrane protein